MVRREGLTLAGLGAPFFLAGRPLWQWGGRVALYLAALLAVGWSWITLPHHDLVRPAEYPAWVLPLFLLLYSFSLTQRVRISAVLCEDASLGIALFLLLFVGPNSALAVIVAGEVLGLAYWMQRYRRRHGGLDAATALKFGFSFAGNVSMVVIPIVVAGAILAQRGFPLGGKLHSDEAAIPIFVVLLGYSVLERVAAALHGDAASPRAWLLNSLRDLKRTGPWRVALGFFGLAAVLLVREDVIWAALSFLVLFFIHATFRQHVALDQQRRQAAAVLSRAIAERRDPGGEVRDLTEQEEPDIVAASQQVSDELRHERELLQFKDDFVRVISHELRTPITALRGYLDLATRGLSEESVPREVMFLNEARRQLDRLVALLDELRQATRADTLNETFTLHCDRGDLGIVVATAAAQFSAAPGTHPIRVEGPLHLMAWFDRGRVEQVLSNLLENATKYSPLGSEIVIELGRQVDEATGGALASIRVRDRGSGVAPADRERIFERFYRSSAVKSRTPGLGIGLYVCRMIVQRHGGRIWVEDNPNGVGSCFAFTLPLAEQIDAAERYAA